MFDFFSLPCTPLIKYALRILGTLPKCPCYGPVFILAHRRVTMKSLLSFEYEEYLPQLFELCKNFKYMNAKFETRQYQKQFRDGSPPSNLEEFFFFA